MRKTLILTLVLCVFAAIAYAQTGTGTTGTATTGTTTSTTTSSTTAGTGAATTTTTTTKTHHKKATAKKSHSVKGTVASVDAANKSFAVHPAKGADVNVKVNDKTKYSPTGKTWDDVKVDAKVTVSYKNDGTDNWATSVKFWPEKAAAPAKTGK